jgi:selenocysteine lyase/cysteine desulfurase
MSASLPPAFAELEPFVGHWAAATTAGRAAARDQAGPEECARFFAAGFPRVEEALNYLDAKGFAGFDAADERLMALMLGLVHAGLAADVQGPDEPRHALTRRDMKLQVSPADLAPAAKDLAMSDRQSQGRDGR